MDHKYLSDLCYRAYHVKHHEAAGIEFIREGSVFAFRGTDDLQDVFRDVRIAKAADDVVIEMMAECLRENIEPWGLTLTGHSLGGAIALVVGAWLQKLVLPPGQIVTFGAPRCGRLKILDDTPVTMYRNGKDVVTDLPPIMRRHRKQTQIGEHRGRIKDHSMYLYTRAVS